jgi:hypothetical protein
VSLREVPTRARVACGLFARGARDAALLFCGGEFGAADDAIRGIRHFDIVMEKVNVILETSLFKSPSGPLPQNFQDEFQKNQASIF